MKRYSKLMLLTGALLDVPLPSGKRRHPQDQFLTCPEHGAEIGSFLNRRYQVLVRSRASFGGRTGP